MVMTILEGRVYRESWAALQQAYQEARQHKEEGLLQSYLIQSSREPELWRILTLWESREVLDAMRRSVDTPRGVLIFRQAHVEPQLGIFEVVEQI